MKPIQGALIGAGGRGIGTFGDYALGNPHDLQFIAVAEPNRERRAYFASQHHIPPERQFDSWEEMLSRPQLCQALVVATMDRLHYAPTMRALDVGYDILLEKPMSTDPLECIRLAEKADAQGRLLMICHVLRYVPFYAIVKRLIDEGQIGRVISIQHNENVGYFHQAHSFVRGNWGNSTLSSPMILSKCCHDMDILVWWMGRRCERVASFGSLTLFRPENAPPGSTTRCTDGCVVERQCPFSALRIYMEEYPDWGALLGMEVSSGTVIQALREGPYGRCVYRCDNDVVDHQVASMEFEGGATVAFTMCGFTHEISRTVKIMGTDGEIRGHAELLEIEIHQYSTGERRVIHAPGGGAGHGGGDWSLLRSFTHILRSENAADRAHALTSAGTSVESHLIALAVEKARLEQRVIQMDEYIREIKRQ
jgi:predicted dehydrogenase